MTDLLTAAIHCRLSHFDAMAVLGTITAVLAAIGLWVLLVAAAMALETAWRRLRRDDRAV